MSSSEFKLALHIEWWKERLWKQEAGTDKMSLIYYTLRLKFGWKPEINSKSTHQTFCGGESLGNL